jgi:cytochrome c oxidase subunit 2
LATLALSLISDPAWAVAHNWQLGFQEAATPVAEQLHGFHHFLLIIITGIVLFVSALLLYVMIRFNARANPVPSATTHNVVLEIIWTMVPVLILILIAIPSFSLLYYMDRTKNPEMTLKVTGYQWYWGYEYPDHGDISFTANMIPDGDIDSTKNQVRGLSTDTPVVLPVDTDIQILVTAADVIHSFAVPAFGIKTDAVPGRTNETWVRIEKPGTYYGQCSELCGTNHGFMPIEVHALSKDDFAAWVIAQGGTMPVAPSPVVLGTTPVEAAPAAAH